jgi:hypothetical protein
MMRAHARPLIGRTMNRALDLLQEGFETDIDADAALTDECGQFQKGDIGYCQAVSILACVVDRGPCPL